MSKNKDRFKSTTGLNDLLFNLLVGFVFLFIVAFLLINPPTKKQDAPKKAEYLIVIEWDDRSGNDIDLWVMDPNRVTVSFTNKEGGLLNLEKDDLGIANDRWVKPDGSVEIIRLNREVVTMRGIVPGRYQVAAHIYSQRDATTPSKVDGKRLSEIVPQVITATLIKINPYGEVYKTTREFNRRGQALTLFNFELDENGIVTMVDERKNNIVYRLGQQIRSE